jgi:hypothetical protein
MFWRETGVGSLAMADRSFRYSRSDYTNIRSPPQERRGPDAVRCVNDRRKANERVCDPIGTSPSLTDRSLYARFCLTA